MTAEKKQDIYELDATEADGSYIVVKPFYLRVRKGPGIIVPRGAVVRLRRESAWIAFTSGRVIPEGIGGEKEYIAVQSFGHINKDGLYEEIKSGTRLLFSEKEAVTYLIRGHIRPCFYLPLFEGK